MEDVPHPASDEQFVAQLTACQLSLWLYVRSLLPGDSAARDVAQQANAKIWEKRTDFQLGTNFKAWAFAIARYEVLNFRKQQARDARLVFSAELERTMATELAEDYDGLQERHEALRHCLGRLRSEDREMLLHRYASPGSLADYAARVGRSVGGLKVALHRLRSSLQSCIERRLRSGEAAL